MFGQNGKQLGNGRSHAPRRRLAGKYDFDFRGLAGGHRMKKNSPAVMNARARQRAPRDLAIFLLVGNRRIPL